MRYRLSLSGLLTICITPGVLGATVQAPFINLPPDAHRHQQAVVNLALDSYQAYKSGPFPVSLFTADTN